MILPGSPGSGDRSLGKENHVSDRRRDHVRTDIPIFLAILAHRLLLGPHTTQVFMSQTRAHSSAMVPSRSRTQDGAPTQIYIRRLHWSVPLVGREPG